MCTYFKLISHIFEGRKDGQLLVDHLKGVCNVALDTTRIHGIKGEKIEKVIETICLCHDFGKASEYFQEYIKGEPFSDLKSHGEISAYFTYYMLPQKWKLIGFLCVKRHHGNIDNINNDFFTPTDKDKLLKISESIKKNIEELNKIYGKDISGFFEKINSGELFKEVKKSLFQRTISIKKMTLEEIVEEFIWIQYIWSLVLTGDKTQLIRGTAYKNKDSIKEDFVNIYKDDIRKKLIAKNSKIKESTLFNIRDKIYYEAVNSVNELDLEKEKLLSINVPTGTGKTISVYGAAFKLMKRLNKEKDISPTLIYNIPFMSVIDQNYDVLQEIFKYNKMQLYEDIILKHHSMSSIEYKDSEEKEYRNFDARFCVENWQSTIITTTFVQFFDSIFKSGINSIMHRFHKLAGGVIILDEVQAIPNKYYFIIEAIIKVLCEKFNTYVITVTATRPLFLIGKDLIKDKEDIFQQMDRIVLENHMDHKTTLNDFKDIVLGDIQENEDKSFLVVLNTVKSTFEVFNYLKEALEGKRKVLYLSTEIIPKRRLEIIKEIKNGKEKYILISTQLIEAGVDLDFDIVYRDEAPLDSINQTAGRANRSGINGKGIVKLYSLIDDNENNFSKYIYRGSAIDVTKKILEGKSLIKESEIGQINKIYFEEMKKATQNSAQEEMNILIDYIAKLRFEDVRNHFKLIEEQYQKEDVIIRYNDEVENCIKTIRDREAEYQQIINAWRALNKYRISITKNDIVDIAYEIKGVKFLDASDYDKNIGVIRRNSFII